MTIEFMQLLLGIKECFLAKASIAAWLVLGRCDEVDCFDCAEAILLESPCKLAGCCLVGVSKRGLYVLL